LRRALAHAIDRYELLQSIQSGIGDVASALVSPRDPDYEAIKGSIVEYEYDPRKSAQLVEGLGYTKGGDGIFRDPLGRELRFETMTALAGENLYEQTTLSIADYWKRAGVITEPRLLRGRVDVSLMADRPGFAVDRLMTQLDARFLSTSVPTAANRYTGTNRARYQSPDLDALLNRYLVTVPRPERLNILADVMRHMTENVVVIHLFYNVGAQVKAQRLKNVEPRTSKSRIYNPEQWDV